MYYILERHNPQINKTTFKALGKMSKKEANKKAASIAYGSVWVQGYRKAEYVAKCKELNIVVK